MADEKRVAVPLSLMKEPTTRQRPAPQTFMRIMEREKMKNFSPSAWQAVHREMIK